MSKFQVNKNLIKDLAELNDNYHLKILLRKAMIKKLISGVDISTL